MYDDTEQTAWMADGACRNYEPSVFFPSDGVGVDRARQDLRDLRRDLQVPRVRPGQPHRPRCVGRLLRA